MESAPSVGVQTSTPGADAPHGFQQALPQRRQASERWCVFDDVVVLRRVRRDSAHWTSGHRRQHRKDARPQSGGCSQAMHSQCRCRLPCLRRIDSRQHHIARSGWPGFDDRPERDNRHAATSLSSVAPSTLGCAANAGTRSSTLCANAPLADARIRRQAHRLFLHVALRPNGAKCLRSPNAPQVQAHKRRAIAVTMPQNRMRLPASNPNQADAARPPALRCPGLCWCLADHQESPCNCHGTRASSPSACLHYPRARR